MFKDAHAQMESPKIALLCKEEMMLGLPVLSRVTAFLCSPEHALPVALCLLLQKG